MKHPYPLHEVQADIYVARRLRVHQVLDQAGVPVHHDKLIIGVLTWLAEQGINHVRFSDDETAYLVTFEPCALDQPRTEVTSHG